MLYDNIVKRLILCRRFDMGGGDNKERSLALFRKAEAELPIETIEEKAAMIVVPYLHAVPLRNEWKFCGLGCIRELSGSFRNVPCRN